jgi:hypothetical protein
MKFGEVVRERIFGWIARNWSSGLKASRYCPLVLLVNVTSKLISYDFGRVELSWCCDRRSVGLSVLVSGTLLGPMTSFFFSFLFLDNCFPIRLQAPSLTRGRVCNLQYNLSVFRVVEDSKRYITISSETTGSDIGSAILWRNFEKLTFGGLHEKHAVLHGIWVPTQHLLWENHMEHTNKVCWQKC